MDDPNDEDGACRPFSELLLKDVRERVRQDSDQDEERRHDQVLQGSTGFYKVRSGLRSERTR